MLVLVGCQNVTSYSRDIDNPPDRLSVPTADVDRGITPCLFPHSDETRTSCEAAERFRAHIDRARPARGLLAVHLPGAGTRPDGGEPLLDLLAGWGFHAISLMYFNNYPIVEICAEDPDPDCHGKLRGEAWWGDDRSPHIAVTRADGGEFRLLNFLLFLDRKFPRDGWSQFIDRSVPGNPGIRWSHVVLSGHSHGASTAAFVSRFHSLKRVVMLSGPFDNFGGAPAPWLSLPSQTASKDVFGLSHIDERQHNQHLRNWDALAASTTPVLSNVTNAYPADAQLFIVRDRAAESSPHLATLPGPWSPTLNGSPLFIGVWRRMWTDDFNLAQ